MLTTPVPLLVVNLGGRIKVCTLNPNYGPISPFHDSQEEDATVPSSLSGAQWDCSNPLPAFPDDPIGDLAPIYTVTLDNEDCGDLDDEEDHDLTGVVIRSRLSVDTCWASIPVHVVLVHDEDRPELEHSARVLSSVPELQGNVAPRFFGLWEEKNDSAAKVYIMVVENVQVRLDAVLKTRFYLAPQVSRWSHAITTAYQRLHDHGVVHSDFRLHSLGVRGVPLRESGEYDDIHPDYTQICLLHGWAARDIGDSDFMGWLRRERLEMVGRAASWQQIEYDNYTNRYSTLPEVPK